MALINCPECGKEVSDKAISCPNCGAVVKKKHSTVGIIGFAISIVALFLGLDWKIILWIISLILCSIGCFEKNKKHGFAIAGNIISFIFLFCILVGFIFAFK